MVTRKKKSSGRDDDRTPSPRIAPQFRQVQTRRTFEEVTAQVRELLFGGSLQPGDRLPAERQLAVLLRIGRPALREALRALEVAGLIELRKGKTGGAFITTGNHKVVSGSMTDLLRVGGVSIEELFEAREWILAALVRPACRRITPAELQQLRENVAEAERLHLAGRYEQRIDRNFEFYSILAASTRNAVSVMVVRGLTDALRGLINAVGTGLQSNYWARRRDLIKALEAGDEDAAARKMVAIVKATEATYKRLIIERLAPLGRKKSLPKAERTKSRPHRAAAVGSSR